MVTSAVATGNWVVGTEGRGGEGATFYLVAFTQFLFQHCENISLAKNNV